MDFKLLIGEGAIELGGQPGFLLGGFEQCRGEILDRAIVLALGGIERQAGIAQPLGHPVLLQNTINHAHPGRDDDFDVIEPIGHRE